jgi:hypothetical protein
VRSVLLGSAAGLIAIGLTFFAWTAHSAPSHHKSNVYQCSLPVSERAGGWLC